MSQAGRYLTAVDLRDGGFLQEVNRLFFHPAGLALELAPEGHGRGRLRVQDKRGDEEGVLFGPGVMDTEKARRVRQEWARHAACRRAVIGPGAIEPPGGAVVQPLAADSDA